MPLTVNDEKSAQDAVAIAKAQGYLQAKYYWDGSKWKVLYGPKTEFGATKEPESTPRRDVNLPRFVAATEHAEKRELQRREVALAQQRAQLAEAELERERTRKAEEPRTFRLPPKAEPYLEAQLEAMEKRRIRAGIAPGREVGAIRYVGGQKVHLPIKVSSETEEAIGQKEMSRLIAAQDALQGWDPYQEKDEQGRVTVKYRKEEILEKAKEQTSAALQAINKKIEAGEELPADYKGNMAVLKRTNRQIDKQLKEIENLRETVRTGGAYSPKVRTGIAIAERLKALEKAEFKLGKGIIEHTGREWKRKGGPIAGMKALLPTPGTTPGYKHLAKIGITGAPRIAQLPSKVTEETHMPLIAQIPGIAGKSAYMPRIVQLPGKPRIADIDWILRREKGKEA